MSAASPVGRYRNPDKVCDVVMKGGITSGVVYPLALTALAKEYRFACIGGTSAGAVAAVAAAAAEYGRHSAGAGFERMEKVPNEVGSHLASMFQPTPALRPLFEIFLAALRNGTALACTAAIIWTAIRGFWATALLGATPGLLIIVIVAALQGGAGGIALGAVLALLGLIVSILWRLLKVAKRELVASDFGLCPGIRQPYATMEGFTDWLARLIDEAAGRKASDEPLTFGDLSRPPGDRPPIELAMMTTSLMERRPYTLPMTDRRFVFERAEWAKLFPVRIMNYLTEKCDPFAPPAAETGEFYYFPDAGRLPLVVGARMSLSFPGLISAVPLWRRDFTLCTYDEQIKLRRCLFSDGGLSSNFPIHFFDRLLPSRPTFAISLDEYDERRNQDDNVWLPASAGSGVEIPVQPFEGIAGFLMRLIDSAKDWQDHLQSTLPGYRERIAHVVLKPNEGGLNLFMDQQTIQRLASYGQDAGEKLRAEFNLDSHRWRRFLVAMARMEDTFDEVARAYEGVPDGLEEFGDFLARYAEDPDHYKQDPTVLTSMLARGAELADIGASWRASPRIRDGRIPRPPTNMRISPKP